VSDLSCKYLAFRVRGKLLCATRGWRCVQPGAGPRLPESQSRCSHSKITLHKRRMLLKNSASLKVSADQLIFSTHDTLCLRPTQHSLRYEYRKHCQRYRGSMMGDRQATFTAKHRHTHATIVIALFAILFASCYRARTECVPQLPNPSGTFAIGRLRGQHLIDSARPDRFSSDRTKYRELMVYVWYPAQQSNHPAFDPYVPGAKQN
jgi:hypothetical protein